MSIASYQLFILA